ncbi:MAG: hypothetical protein WC156_03090 [Pedobacter sp.]
MTNLLLITDIPRLRKIFSRFSDNKDIRIRIVNNLEKGGEEIIADKPSMVFVQTHLSGLSADILLMHLKKQLGRKRTRFVLLSPPDQVSNATLKLYHGQLDTSLNDNALFDAIREIIASLDNKGKKAAPTTTTGEFSVTDLTQKAVSITETQALNQTEQITIEQQPVVPMPPETPELSALPHTTDAEPSLEEQGVIYAPRSRVSVYSEFTSSFDSAVSSIQPGEETDETPKEHLQSWNHKEVEKIDLKPVQNRSKGTTFLLWLAPLLIAVVVVTMFQYSKSTNKPPDVASQTADIKTQTPVKPTATIAPVVAGTTQATPAPPAPSTTLAPKPGNKAVAAKAEVQLREKTMLSASAENRGQKVQSKAVSDGPRLKALPDFIPRAGLDKEYIRANPGWERYKENVTEFKIYPESDKDKKDGNKIQLGQAPVKSTATITPVVAGTTQATPAPAAPSTPTTTLAPKPGNQTPSAKAETQLSEKAILLAIAESSGQKVQSKAVPDSPRLTALPDFIPRSRLDKKYSRANPGWERYKGKYTEFKIYYENDTIKMIQVIDHGGQGVPESFMKGVLRQLSKKPVFIMNSSEKKDGYEIQRGQVAENLSIVYYRDEKGGKLRAFVATWK